MAHMFDKVAAFYELDDEAEDILPQATLEQYLRRQLWRGAGESELAIVVSLATIIVDVVEMMGYEAVGDFDAEDLKHVVDRYFLDEELSHVKEAQVLHVLDLLTAFLIFLYPAAKQEYQEMQEETRASYYIDGEFIDPTAEQLDDDDALLMESIFEDLDPAELDAIVNGLLQSIQDFYRKECYRADLQRAMLLFFGPWHDMPAPEDEEAIQRELQGFWDFFLFDYHMIADDKLPLSVFFEAKKQELPEELRAIVRDLLASTFTVFYVDRLVGGTACCRDLFTGAEMELPRPETGGQDPRKTLLYGHVHANGVMLLNYILIVPATAALRRRIKEEIHRLYAIYQLQDPDATIAAFFSRHAAAVRHIIQRMTSYAQLTVVPDLEPPRQIQTAELPRSHEAAAAALGASLQRLHFSLYEQKTVQRLYRDAVSALGRTAHPDAPAFLAGVVMYFAIQNRKDVGDMETFFQSFRAEQHAVVNELSRIFVALGMQHPDPRYLTEIGFLHLLYMTPETPDGAGDASQERSNLHAI